MTEQLLIDSQIRDWVLLPIVFVMLLFGVLRHYVTLILRSTPRAPDEDKLRQQQTLLRSQILFRNNAYIPASSFQQRKQVFNSRNGGLLHEKVENNPLAQMSDPTQMMDMMKGNMAGLVPNLLMLGFISYFFAGFVIAKFPFPLTTRFRGMVQRGIDLNSLDITYVTSASMYFLILFGIRGVMSLILGEDSAADDAQMMNQQTAMMGGAMMSQPGFDVGKAMEAERENLELVQHAFKLKDAEDLLLSNKSPYHDL